MTARNGTLYLGDNRIEKNANVDIKYGEVLI